MAMTTATKFKKFTAMLLAFALAFGTVPITAAASPMELTFISGQQSGLSVGDYFVDFAAGNFPFMYEATEGDSLVFSLRLLIEKSASILFISHQHYNCLTEYLH